MLVQNISPGPPSLNGTSLINTKSWQVGQILEAIVQGKERSGILEIKIGNKALKTYTTQSYPVGKP
jgi:hypothetical protein